MFDFLHFIPHDLGTALTTWAIMIALWATFAAGLVECAKENDGNGATA